MNNILDRNSHKDEIQEFIELKGESKLNEFVEILKTNNELCSWKYVLDLYRYDKRLLINIFKYLSFFEEFLISQLKLENYKKCKMSMKSIMEEIINNKTIIEYNDFDNIFFKNNYEALNKLRNNVCHNKIIINVTYKNQNINKILEIFKNILPQNYRKGFVSDINKCKKGLNLPDSLVVKII
ncbi:hypothetical protein [Metamycoplasma buccale]|uniref:hypothetical protein n=1 Tax=Metamycoplasma buccale TaxID=55602 RepID=UPI00398EA346